MDMINIGYSGASTAQVELNVTAQNTANAMTTGYTRQVAEISTIGASGGSPNSAGNGVQVDSIKKKHDHGLPPSGGGDQHHRCQRRFAEQRR
ncbi:lateral flagellar hook associated protein 1 [Escherichia coli SHECO001]|nr:lateral flagellar hook associated protein 1 [Escherichia coli SHECO001]